MLLCIDNFSFIVVDAAAWFIENEDNMPQIPCYPHVAVKKKIEREWHIKKSPDVQLFKCESTPQLISHILGRINGH